MNVPSLFHLQALRTKTEKQLWNSVALNIDGTQNSSQYRPTVTINFSELHCVLISVSEKSLKKDSEHMLGRWKGKSYFELFIW